MLIFKVFKEPVFERPLTLMFTSLIFLLLTAGVGADQSEVEQHLEMGKKLLAAGQLADALSHYHAAVGKLPQIQTELKNFEMCKKKTQQAGETVKI